MGLEQHWAFMLGVTLMLGACSVKGAGEAMTDVPPTDRAMPTPAAEPEVATRGSAVKAVPDRFRAYASTPLRDGAVCTVGIETDEDGMNQKPLVYMSDSNGQARWLTRLPLPTHTYQARATGCLQQGNKLYVLVQADTQPAQTISQTLLSVASISAGDGRLTAVRSIEVPNASGAYSAWVGDKVGGFTLENGRLVVKGLYFRMDERDKRRAFSVGIQAGL